MHDVSEYKYISDEDVLKWIDEIFRKKEDKIMGLFQEVKTLDEGIYEAEITDISLIETKFGEKYRISFKVMDGENEYNLGIFAGQVIGKRSKVYKLIKALNINKAIEKIEKQDLVGKKLKVVIKNDDRGFPRIAEFLPL